MFSDTHAHLCPGLDDGPRTMAQSLRMCQIAWNEGIRHVACVAHQNSFWPEVTPASIVDAAAEVTAQLQSIGCDMQLVPTAEVVVTPELLEQWAAGELLSVGNHGKYLLIEMPHGIFLDIRNLVAEMVDAGINPVLAHTERYPEIFYGKDYVLDLIQAGCVIQVSATAFTDQRDRRRTKILKDWAQRQIIHVIGTDAHSADRRPPHMAAAFETYRRWTDTESAQRVFCDNGHTILTGKTLRVPQPRYARKRLTMGRLLDSITFSRMVD